MPLDNPFTRYLRERLGASDRSGEVPDPEALARRWDDVETLVIQVYRSGVASADDHADWRAVRRWFAEHYGAYRPHVGPHAAGTLAGGQPVDGDPMAYVLRPERAYDLIDNRAVMVHLPAAREALNRWLIALRDDGAASDS